LIFLSQLQLALSLEVFEIVSVQCVPKIAVLAIIGRRAFRGPWQPCPYGRASS
jgi:hypothetical protein